MVYCWLCQSCFKISSMNWFNPKFQLIKNSFFITQHHANVSNHPGARLTILITIYGVDCVQLAHFNIGDWKDISIAHVIIIIKSEVSTFPIVIFSVVLCLRCLLRHILSLIAHAFRENLEFVFIIIVQFMMSANIRIRFGLQIAFVCLYSTPYHYLHCANLSVGIGQVRLGGSVRNYFSVRTILKSTGYCKLPR